MITALKLKFQNTILQISLLVQWFRVKLEISNTLHNCILQEHFNDEH